MINLVRERQNGGRIWGDEVGVDRRSTISVVIGVQKGFIVLCGDEADPICATRSSISRVCRVSQRVRVVWDGAVHRESGLGIRVAAILLVKRKPRQRRVIPSYKLNQ